MDFGDRLCATFLLDIFCDYRHNLSLASFDKWRWQSYAMSLECHILYSLKNIVKLCESVWIFEYYSFHLTSLRLIFLWLSLCLCNNYHIAIMRNNTYFKISCLRYDFMPKLEVIREKNSMSTFHVLCPFTVTTLTREWV